MVAIHGDTGDGIGAKVGDDYRLWVDAITKTEILNAALMRKAFMFSTGIITSVATADSAILVIKNEDPRDLHLYDVRTCNSSPDADWKQIKNPTTGTMFSSGTQRDPENTDTGAAEKFVGDNLFGADGLTITDGIEMGTHINGKGHSTMNPEGVVILRQGKSIGYTVNTYVSARVCMTILGYYGNVRT